VFAADFLLGSSLALVVSSVVARASARS
jgi:hypothetical protein